MIDYAITAVSLFAFLIATTAATYVIGVMRGYFVREKTIINGWPYVLVALTSPPVDMVWVVVVIWILLHAGFLFLLEVVTMEA